MRGTITASVLAILCLPVVSAAQEPVKSFDQLNTRLRVGDTVWVTDVRGREVKGRITSLASDALGVDADGALALPAEQVRVVQNRRHDSLARGAWIGAVVGFGVGAALTYAVCSSDECSGGGAAMFALTCMGAGAGVGVGVDAAVPGRRQVVYRAPGMSGSARFSLGPVITSRTKGLAVSYSF